MTEYTLKIAIQNAEMPLKPTPFWGSLMHGILIGLLSEDLQAELHAQSVRPYSQWIETDGRAGFIWHVCVYSDALAGQLDAQLKQGARFRCRHLKCDFFVASCARRVTSLQDYMKDIFSGERAPERIRLKFCTTTSHKVDGQYVLFPSVELISRSLRSRIVQIDEDTVLGDDGVLDDIIAHTRIARYDLRSGSFELEGARVYGFTGWVELSLGGPDALRRLASMLYRFAPYCGVGIKTALGMGGCLAEVVERNVRR